MGADGDDAGVSDNNDTGYTAVISEDGDDDEINDSKDNINNQKKFFFIIPTNSQKILEIK